MQIDYEVLYNIYKDVRKNVKNKIKVSKFDEMKITYLSDIKYKLENNLYDGGKYNISLIYYPKIRVIMSGGIYDKIINHYVARYILIPKLEKYLDNRNVATRKNMGVNLARKYVNEDLEWSKNFKNSYVLKLDIKKFFPNIDHEIIKNKIQKYLSCEEYNLVCKIIDSTDKPYVNEKIKILQKSIDEVLPLYKTGKGLNLGSMTSQFLAIYYLSDLHHFIRHNLGLKHFTVYMDDYLIFHNDIEYLRKCKKIIENKLLNEYKLELNDKKTFVTNVKSGFEFLGYTYKIVNNKTIRKIPKNSKQRIKKNISRKIKEYKKGQIEFQNIFCALENYKGGYKEIDRKIIENMIDLN